MNRYQDCANWPLLYFLPFLPRGSAAILDFGVLTKMLKSGSLALIRFGFSTPKSTRNSKKITIYKKTRFSVLSLGLYSVVITSKIESNQNFSFRLFLVFFVISGHKLMITSPGDNIRYKLSSCYFTQAIEGVASWSH